MESVRRHAARRRPPRYRRVRQGTYDTFKVGPQGVELRDPYHLAVTLRWPAFIAGCTSIFLFINVVFALLYLAEPGALTNVGPGDFARAFFFSLETISTVGYGEMAPHSGYGHLISSVEMVFGIAFVALLTGVLVFRFSQARDGILFAEVVVVTQHDGRSTLMVRCANARFSMLTAAKATLYAFLREESVEGLVFRRHHNLKVVNPTLPAFPITWTVMHVIDEESPLHGYDAVKLHEAWGRLFLCVEARDAKLNRTVHEIGDWDATRVLFGERYVDAVTYDEDGTPRADLTVLGCIRPHDEAPGRSSAYG